QPLVVGRPGGVVVPGGVFCQVALVGAVGLHDVNLVIAVAVGSEGDLLAVGGPNRPIVQGGVMRQPADLAAVGVHDVNLQIATPPTAKGDLLTVGRPTGIVVGGDFAGQPADVLTVGVGDINFLVAIARAHKGDLLAIGRPAGGLFKRFVGDHHLVVGAIGVDRVDVEFAVSALQDVVNVNDAFAVGGPMAVKVRRVQNQKSL